MLGPFLIIKNIISEEIFSSLKNILFKYIRREHGYKSDICVITVSPPSATYTLSTTSGVVPSNLKGIEAIRASCGQHVLMRYGLPQENDPPFVLKLFITPSFIKTFGIMNSIKFCKEWVGDSRVGDVVVVKYI